MPDELASILEILRENADLHGDTLELFRIVKTRLERIEGAQVELVGYVEALANRLRDEVSALASRLEALTRLVNARTGETS